MNTPEIPVPPLTLRELANRLSVTDDVARYLLRSEKIAGFKVGGRWRIPPEAVADYVVEQLSRK